VSASASPVRVCFVMDRLPVGGAEMMLLAIASQLDRSRCAPEVLCLREAGPMAERFVAAGVPVFVLGRRSRWDLSTPIALARWFRRRGTRVVCLTAHHAPLLHARLAARLSGAANVVTIHNMGGRSAGLGCLPPWAVETLFLTDALVTLAPAQGRYLREVEGVGRFPWRRARREVVIPNGTSVPPAPQPATRAAARRELGLGDDDQVVTMVAAMRPDKAHDVLIRAVARLAPSRPRLRLVLIGGGEREPALRELAAEEGVSGVTTFAGVRSDVAALLPAADVVALASYPVRETFPVSVLEAMAAARPVVVTECGALADMVEEGVEGFRVPPEDDAALAARLAELLDDPGRARAMGAAGRARVQRDFTIEGVAHRYEDLFVGLAARRGDRGAPDRGA
jgi:glycosyltransferase involved in cell wall biosynthesis